MITILATTTTTSTTTPAQVAAGGAESLARLLLFGAFVLLVFGAIYWFSRNSQTQKRTINVTFSRLYGLMTVAVLGVALAFANLADEARTAAFTLLGTVAGYLAGAQPTTTTTPPGGATVETVL